ncbi:formylglycine-generating enzyme family protein [Halopiger aswanensis]|uniref:Formylglycine-generating enzyme required for sulfatase activity n=1 Tax=Halopiger aswanensis TaxID=148449 RepID=A0A3R7FTQ2_9EURY|nr:formylglycine-generating enzyme family protein [Halopiger aswanensis]RKD89229.1 formylglycine-generating enzyme required for sulfatase activity [Halopiger aswanensis]
MTNETPSCCSPSKGGSRTTRDATTDRDGESASAAKDAAAGEAASANAKPTGNETRMRRLLGGTFRMGTDSEVGFEDDGEGPAREVVVDPFAAGIHAVTNAEFYEFVRETGYTTDAERHGWSFVFEEFLTPDAREHVVGTSGAADWWVGVEGACWYRPKGPGSSIEDRLDHPVVHVSWNDAVAYCDWADRRLPTEAEWEYAARGGREGTRFPWGDELEPHGEHRCNVWQGSFPEHNTASDGYLGTAPVDAFEPNGYGLYNVVGNVWEWCADWFDPDYHETTAAENPTGPDDGRVRSMRGGSHLCHESWCNRYRLAARSKNTPASSTGNIGFRCVANV